MTWFKIDDSAHMHPKVIAAGNAALGLWLRCGAYSAQHLTEGAVPAAVAKQYGTAPQAAKLVKVGLWHEHGHTCPRCPQPAAGDYVVHDFFEGGRNATRAQVEAGRTAAAERKAKSRAGKNGARFADDPSADRARNERGSAPNQERTAPPIPEGSTGQEGESQRDARECVTGPQTNPKPYPSTSFGSRGKQASPDGPRIAEPVRPLVDAMSAAGMVVSWQLESAEWLLLHALIERCGVAVLVDHAGGAWQAARTRPRSARYFLAGWRSLPAMPATAPEIPGHSPNVVALHNSRPSTTDQRVRDGLDLAARLREQELAQ
ncbi:mucin-2 [Streptomyces kasugaensis]|uniref:Mucin-2 n=1 Tax=Streptomyces kasugaensis TaxID=1946 RepID=A0A4Q9HXC1_STRKA|nr:mucin-2 [Streptomyces kasugaensis]TBO59877.1 mucin-2 [Streptomyces kasugaensis]